jgi:4-aminobutyrate aminotransferase-like enzyme/aminoglycoside phosphotransferase (APT) family kinase protein
LQQRIFMTARETLSASGRASPGIKFLRRNPPSLSVAEVRRLLAGHYDLDGDLRPLPSERDQNFLLACPDRQRFVLKVANGDESADVVECYAGALRHIATQDPPLPVPRIVASRDGRYFFETPAGDGQPHIVCLLTFLDGALLDDMSSRISSATRRNLARTVARVDKALRGYFHPAAAQVHPWNLGSFDRLRHLVDLFGADEDRALLHDVFEDYSQRVLPRLRTLRHQVIHQDAHPGNVLADPDDPATITGIIDFGDLLFGTLAAEVAVACNGVTDGTENPVAAACDFVAAFDAELPLEEDELDLVFDLMVVRNAMTAVVAGARLEIAPDEPAHIPSPQPFVRRVAQFKDLGRGRFSRELRRACRFPVYCPTTPGVEASKDEEARLVEARRALMGRNTTHFYEQPMHFERGRGPWLYATDGRRYLDFYNNVAQIGHCHPHVVRAISRQAAALNTNTRYLYSSVLDYAERLTGRLARHLTACLFVNSGSEANDVAWQMAKTVTGHTGAVIMEDAYHGVTDVMRLFSPGRPEKPLPDFLEGIIVPDPYRGPFRDRGSDLAAAYAADADRAIAALDAAGHPVAAFMVDSAFCSSGIPDVPDGYLRAVEARVRAAGGLMICDEVQSGFGRMGRWWGHEHHGVRADIVTMGKPVGNGFPLGVVVTTDEILNEFIDRTRLFSTFGGNAVASAAGNAVLDVIGDENLVERSRATGDLLRRELRNLAAEFPLIGDVRGHGLVTGVELVSDRERRSPATRETSTLIEAMRERGVLVGSDGRDANVLKLRPPLVITPDEVARFAEALGQSLGALSARSAS